MMKRLTIYVLTLLSMLTACSSLEPKAEYPLPIEDRRAERGGKLTGEGLVLFGGKTDTEAAAPGTNGIGINSYLWRATLDTLSFMPLASADPFGGVIITDWHEEPSSPGERFKMNVLILDQRLRSNAIKLRVFRQVKKDDAWVHADVSQNIASDLETKILTRARELRNAQK